MLTCTPVAGTVAYSVSSTFPDPAHCTGLALNSQVSWCASTLNTVTSEFVQMDAGSVALIQSVTTQGRYDTPYLQWVTSYNLYYSTDGMVWTLFGNLVGNTDSNTQVTHVLMIFARYLKLAVTSYSGWVSMRAGMVVVQGYCPWGFYSTIYGATTSAVCTACASGTYAVTTGILSSCLAVIVCIFR